jgi:pyruvate dehydrogenase E1 component beta subunit
VLDLRSLQPLDEDGILEALARTGRLVVIDEAPPRCGIASDVAALCVDRGFDYLRAPVKRISAPHAPVPFSPGPRMRSFPASSACSRRSADGVTG